MGAQPVRERLRGAFVEAAALLVEGYGPLRLIASHDPVVFAPDN